jgi:hypothetical protein
VLDLVSLSKVKESSGLCAVNYLSQRVMEEIVLDFELVD